MANTMKNLTLKITALLVFTLSSTQLFAKSPWADEEPVTAEPVSIDSPVESQPVSSPIPAPAPVAINEPAPDPIPETIPEPAPATENFVPEAYTEQTQQGDALNINQSSDAVAVTVLNFPRRGMSTDKVKNELGKPSEIISGVGQPPISRWVYDDRTVYFEYSTVLHVVAK